MFFTYVLRSEKTKRYYVGSTENLENRLKEHNSGETRSIRDGISWQIVHTEQFKTRGEAIRKEKQIKAQGAGRYLSKNNSPG